MQKDIINICIPYTSDRRSRMRELLQSIEECTQGVKYRVILYENQDGGYVKAVHTMLKGVEGYVIVVESDVIVKPDWLATLWRVFWEKFPDGSGVVFPFNNMQGESLCHMPLCRVDTFLRYMDPGFIHCYSDNWFTEIAKHEGKLVYVPEAIIEHNHCVNGKAPRDAGYEISLNGDLMKIDEQHYKHLKQIHGI